MFPKTKTIHLVIQIIPEKIFRWDSMDTNFVIQFNMLTYLLINLPNKIENKWILFSISPSMKPSYPSCSWILESDRWMLVCLNGIRKFASQLQTLVWIYFYPRFCPSFIFFHFVDDCSRQHSFLSPFCNLFFIFLRALELSSLKCSASVRMKIDEWLAKCITNIEYMCVCVCLWHQAFKQEK